MYLCAADGTQLAGLVVSAKGETALTLFDPKTGLARAGLIVVTDGHALGLYSRVAVLLRIRSGYYGRG